jgi:hypothetical protein
MYGGEESAASRFVCNISNVPDRILIGEGPSVHCSVVATKSTNVFFLRDEMEMQNPRAIGTRGCAVFEYLLEIGFRDPEAVWC